jgi:hypothetical protein
MIATPAITARRTSKVVMAVTMRPFRCSQQWQ